MSEMSPMTEITFTIHYNFSETGMQKC